MKKLNSIAIGLLFLLLAVGANAQSKAGADFFAGKWKVLCRCWYVAGACVEHTSN